MKGEVQGDQHDACIIGTVSGKSCMRRERMQRFSIWNLIPLKGLRAPRKVCIPRDLGNPVEGHCANPVSWMKKYAGWLWEMEGAMEWQVFRNHIPEPRVCASHNLPGWRSSWLLLTRHRQFRNYRLSTLCLLFPSNSFVNYIYCKFCLPLLA